MSEPRPEQKYSAEHVPDDILRRRALAKIAASLTTEYLMVLAWRLHVLDEKGFGSVFIQYRNGHPVQVEGTDSWKPHMMSSREIEMMAQLWECTETLEDG